MTTNTKIIVGGAAAALVVYLLATRTAQGRALYARVSSALHPGCGCSGCGGAAVQTTNGIAVGDAAHGGLDSSPDPSLPIYSASNAGAGAGAQTSCGGGGATSIPAFMSTDALHALRAVS